MNVKAKRQTLKMLEDSKRKLAQKMLGYVDAIKLIAYAKLRDTLRERYDIKQAGLLAAATSNHLFGCSLSPLHANIPATLINELAKDFLQIEDNKDFIYGIVMSLRTLVTVKANTHAKEEIPHLVDALERVKMITPLPPEIPNPVMMERLADKLKSQYL